MNNLGMQAAAQHAQQEQAAMQQAHDNRANSQTTLADEILSSVRAATDNAESLRARMILMRHRVFADDGLSCVIGETSAPIGFSLAIKSDLTALHSVLADMKELMSYLETIA